MSRAVLQAELEQAQMLASTTGFFKTPTGRMFGYGPTVPSDGATGWGNGALFIDNDASVDSLVFVNIGDTDSANFDALDQTTLVADLASTANGKGASTIGVEDSGSLITATTVEAALAEVFRHILTAQGHVDIPLHCFREVDADGDVANLAGHGGILASDSTPVLSGVGTTNAAHLLWATGNVDRIAAAVTLPADFDGAQDATVDLIVQSGGTTNDFDAVLVTNWDGGADVSDTVVDSAATATHKSSATVAAADIPDAPLSVTVSITPPTHGTDTLLLFGARIRYQKKLLTS